MFRNLLAGLSLAKHVFTLIINRVWLLLLLFGGGAIAHRDEHAAQLLSISRSQTYSVNLTCDIGVISDIQFGVFGAPVGTCGSLSAEAGCDVDLSSDILNECTGIRLQPRLLHVVQSAHPRTLLL